MIWGMNKPTISIITVTLNNLEGFKKTHGSISLQTTQNFEWIVIDGGSTDGTPEYLKTTNAQWISQPDNGIYDAMNKGIEKASGAYFLFLNAGDALAAPGTLATILDATKDNPDFIYGDSLEDGHLKKAHPHTKIENGLFTHHQAMLYARAKIGTYRYDANYKIAADYDFTARFLQSNTNALSLPIPLCIFEPGGISQKNAFLGRAEQFLIRRKLQMVGPLTNALIFITQTLLWNLRRLSPKLYWALKSRIMR
jgi:putative colanic acid biosynthesis glycosyltransferase